MEDSKNKESEGKKSSSVELINTLISSIPSVERVSDGNFTFGDLHSERTKLITLVIEFISKLSTGTGNSSKWVYTSGSEESGIMYIGCSMDYSENLDSPISLGFKVTSSILEELINSWGYKEILTLPELTPLNAWAISLSKL